MRSVRSSLAVVALTVAAGCSGGGGGSSALPPAATAAAPNAVAPVPTAAALAAAQPNTPIAPGTSVATIGTGMPQHLPASTNGTPFIVQSVRTGNASGNAIDVKLQNAVAPGDLLIAEVGMGDGTEATIVQPSGWPPIDRAAAGTQGAGLAVFSRVATSADVGASYHFWVQGPNATVPLSAALYEISGATSVASNAQVTALSGWSATSPTLTPSGTALALAFLVQDTSGQAPAYFNGTNGWAGVYSPIFGQNYAVSAEAVSYTTGGGFGLNMTETWQNGHNGPQVGELLLVGSSGTSSVPSAPSAPSTPVPTVAPATAPPSAPSTGPQHAHSMLFYGGKFENIGVPASTMVRYADFVYTAETPTYANNFMNAGGSYAAVYTDPHYVPGCDYGTSCSGPMGNTQPEGAWLHDASGRRLRSGDGQDALDPASSATQSAYNSYTHGLTDGTRFNAVIEDDAGPHYIAGDYVYKFGAQPVEYGNLSDPVSPWLNGEEALARSSSQPVIYNGGENDAQDLAFLTSTNVLGHMIEGCTSFTAWRVNDSQGNPLHLWRPSLNKLLAATTRGKYAICLNYAVTGGDVVGDRLYGMASWWLTYDQKYSVAFPDYTTPDTLSGQPSHVYAEYQIVPTQPLQNPGSDVDNLRTGSGAYVREFAACYQNGTLIGRCATVVNPAWQTTVATPPLSGSYSRHLVLDVHSAVNGGQATFQSGGAPSSIAPETGIVLLQ